MKTNLENSKRLRTVGFSLLELLAVVTILGIIAVVVIPRISVSAGTARTNARAQNLSELNAAIERYYFDLAAFPGAALGELQTAGYLPDGIPQDPITKTKPGYVMDTNNRAKVK